MDGASTRYLVNRPLRESNVGSNLGSLAGALWLGAQLGRRVVVDWRGLSQLHDPEVNYFSAFFETPPRSLGADVLYAPADVDYGEEDGPGWLTADDASRIARGIQAEPEETLVIRLYHGLDRLHAIPEAAQWQLLRSFYRDLRPAPAVAAAVESFARDRLGGAFVVGLNVRTGNGHYFGKGGEYSGRVDVSLFENRRRFLRTLERACRARVRALPKPLRDSFAVFYATDSEWMSELLASLPNAVTRRTVFPPPNAGDMFAFPAAGGYTDRDAVVDTLADMFLLARADAFVFNTSMFNQYARVTTGEFSGNEVHIESLFLRKRARRAWMRAVAAAGRLRR